ncbi:MAG: hypothetical protein NT092_09625, partial [Bacteroidia bacterium]|nr:hypothetical protein [Bacteroidia bacterium]
MKTKLSLTLLLSFSFCLLSSQIPQGFNYQAVAQTGAGAPISNATIQVKLGILSDTITPAVVWEELHPSVKTNLNGVFSLVLGKGTRQSGSATLFDDIDWSVNPLYLKVQIYYQGAWKYMGSAKLWSVPYAMVAGDMGGPVKKLSVTGETSSSNEALFEVKNKDGQTVFAVYNEGVRIYVSNGTKAVKGGFAVGGFGTDKAESTKYLFVGKDSVRIYLDTNPLTKATKGGFAVGGYDLSKGTIQNYLDVSADSTRIYVNEAATKGVKGGFAVGGFDMTKGTIKPFTSLTPENYFIGHEGGNSLTSGKYNSVLGYQSGKYISSGESNAFIGYQSGFSNNTGSGNLFLGYKTGYSNQAGNYNSFLGYLAGLSNTTGVFNTFLGSFSGYSNTHGSNNTFVGDSTGYYNLSGINNTFLGTVCGLLNTSGSSNVMIGNAAGKLAETGNENIFIGTYSGFNSKNTWGNVNIGFMSGFKTTTGNAN